MSSPTLLGVEVGSLADWAGAAANFAAVTVALYLASYNNRQQIKRDRGQRIATSLGSLGVGAGALDLLTTIHKDIIRAREEGTKAQQWGPNLRSTRTAMQSVIALGHFDPAVIEALAAILMWVEAIIVCHSDDDRLLRLDGTSNSRDDQRDLLQEMMKDLIAQS